MGGGADHKVSPKIVLDKTSINIMIKDIFKTYSEHDIYTKSLVSKNQEHVETIKGFRVSELS